MKTLPLILYILLLVLGQSIIKYHYTPLEVILSDHRLFLKASMPPVNLSYTSSGHREITGYSSEVAQTDSTPFITASGQRVRKDLIACPRYLPFGTVLQIDEKIYYCGDRMNERYEHRFDRWFPTKQEALDFGLQYCEVYLIQ